MEHLEVVTGPVVVQTGTLTNGQATVTGLTTSSLQGAVGVSGTGIPLGTAVQSIDSAGQVTMNQPATASGSVSLTFTLEPVMLAEAKLHLRQDQTTDDLLIARLISAARRRAEVLLRQTLILQTYDWFMDQFPAAANGYFNRLNRMMGPNPQWLPNGAAILYIPKPPLVSVASVKYYDPTGTQQTYDPTKYFVSTGVGSRVQPTIGNVWPVIRPQIDGVVVRFTAGVSDASQIPEDVKAAMLLMIGHWYEHREEVSDAETYPVPSTIDALLSATDHGCYA